MEVLGRASLIDSLRNCGTNSQQLVSRKEEIEHLVCSAEAVAFANLIYI